MGFFEKVTARVAALPETLEGLLEVKTLRGEPFTRLGLCLGQLRHVMHHVGAVNELLRARGVEPVAWVGL